MVTGWKLLFRHRAINLPKSLFSKYHFSRIFEAMVGETPFEFIKRLRLEKAATLLRFYQADISPRMHCLMNHIPNHPKTATLLWISACRIRLCNVPENRK